MIKKIAYVVIGLILIGSLVLGVLNYLKLTELTDELGQEPEQDLLIGAYYYGWYGKGNQWGEYKHTNTPVLGEYDSRDEAVINLHITWASEHGIDFFAMSWWGPESYEDVTLKDHYLKASKAGDLAFCIHYESTLLGKPEDEPIDFNELYSESQTKGEKFLADMDYIAEEYFDNPQYLRTEADRPVVIFYIARDYVNASSYFKELKINMADKGYDPFLIADVVSERSPIPIDWDFISGSFDAITGYNTYTATDVGDPLIYIGNKFMEYKNYADAYALHFIPSAMPGYNDRLKEDDFDRPVWARNAGGFFRANWNICEENIDPELRMVLITSFNEWHEGTEIEPSAEYGTFYLDLLRGLK
jgi:hypothetical protein